MVGIMKRSHLKSLYWSQYFGSSSQGAFSWKIHMLLCGVSRAFPATFPHLFWKQLPSVFAVVTVLRRTNESSMIVLQAGRDRRSELEMIDDRQMIPDRIWSLEFFLTCFSHWGAKSPESARECASPAGWWAASTPAVGSPGDSSGLTPTERTGGLSVSQVLQVEEQFVLDYRRSHSFRIFSTSQGSNALFWMLLWKNLATPITVNSQLNGSDVCSDWSSTSGLMRE